ncbi:MULTISPECIES: hypothetical protein [Microbulbifer]|uniref:YrhK domain-containing protein n=1 Tax=Microbulbifer celer TaxID=435905 RepID=A0ABW3U8X4_9GAMM|nr:MULTISPECIES: hypothetical protein [Microbulbifer]UFN56635.1 hypothetical protein LPW13_13820 [Microbulbifer celer]
MNKEGSATRDESADLNHANPGQWIELSHSKVGPFLTRKVFLSPEKVRIIWRSREQRKCYNRLQGSCRNTWWAPTAISWWIGILFALGSSAFMLGSVPAYATWVGVSKDNLTFFIGSIFFTSAAFLQYLEVAATAWSPGGGFISQVSKRKWQPLLVEVHRIDWWAVVIQLIGTLCFNVSTFHALTAGAGVSESNTLVWRPDLYGSICFLLSSYLAWVEVCHKWGAVKLRLISWWVVAVNLLGSVAFGVSAIASYKLPSGTMVNPTINNVETFIGAGCFFIGGLLLLPERASLMKVKLLST